MHGSIMRGDTIYLKLLGVAELTEDYLDWADSVAITSFIRTEITLHPRKLLSSRLDEIQENQSLFFSVFDEATNECIGNAHIDNIDGIHRYAVFKKIIVHPDHIHKGRECLVLLLRYGFHFIGLNRMWTTLRIDDEAELNDQAGIGIQREGISRQAAFCNGRFIDGVVMAMIHEDFDRLHGSSDEWPETGGLARPLEIE